MSRTPEPGSQEHSHHQMFQRHPQARIYLLQALTFPSTRLCSFPGPLLLLHCLPLPSLSSACHGGVKVLKQCHLQPHVAKQQTHVSP